MLEWTRELVNRLRRMHTALMETPKNETGEQRDSRAPTVRTGAFERFLREYRDHNEEEVSHHTPGNRAA